MQRGDNAESKMSNRCSSEARITNSVLFCFVSLVFFYLLWFVCVFFFFLQFCICQALNEKQLCVSLHEPDNPHCDRIIMRLIGSLQ